MILTIATKAPAEYVEDLLPQLLDTMRANARPEWQATELVSDALWSHPIYRGRASLSDTPSTTPWAPHLPKLIPRMQLSSSRAFLGLPAPTRYGPFMVVEAANGVSLDFCTATTRSPHSTTPSWSARPSFDEIFDRITARGLSHWADPGQRRAGAINTRDGGRGVYFEDPEATSSRSLPGHTAAAAAEPDLTPGNPRPRRAHHSV